MGWDGASYLAVDETVAFQLLQRLGEHFLAHAVDPAAQVTEAEWAVGQPGQDQGAPPSGEVLEHRPRRARPGEDIEGQRRGRGFRGGVVRYVHAAMVTTGEHLPIVCANYFTVYFGGRIRVAIQKELVMFVVTGATGKFGRLAVDALLRRGVPADQLAVAVRDETRAGDLAARGVTVRIADYDRPETLAPAFADADKLLFVSANGPDDLRLVQHAAVVDAGARAGVGLVAYTSIVGADTNPLSLARVHRDTEARLAAAGVPTVLLRNGWYTENYTATLADAVERGTLVGAAGRGAIAGATRADLAEAAAIVLTAPENQAGRTYELTGDAAWTLADLATEATAVSGKTVSYTDLPATQYAEILTGAGLPGFLVELLVDADTRIAEGALATVTPDLARLLGRPATSLHDAVVAAL